MVGPLAWKRLGSWTKRVVLLTGKVGSGSVLRAQLPLLKSADLVLLVTWKGELVADHWAGFTLLEVDTVSVDPRLSSSEPQDTLLRAGLEFVQGLAPVAADVLVIKSRPDALLPEGLVEHIFELDYSLPPEVLGRPFLRRIWVPWIDALMPFYIADDVFAGSLSDLRQLRWPWNAVRPVKSTMGRTAVHVHRWLAPFLQWYPFLFAFRRNLYDLTDKLVERVPVGAQRQGRGHSSAILEAASSSSLRPDLKDHLVKLLSIYFHLVVGIFRVGGGPCEPGGGVHLLLTSNTSIEAGVVHRPRLLAGNQALRCPNLTASGLAQWRRQSHPQPGQGLLEVSRQSFTWYRPVFDLSWHQAVLDGLTSPDGLSELLPLQAPPVPTHFATLEGLKVSQRNGRFQEEIQTAWCWDLGEGPSSWTSCLGGPSDLPAVHEKCCFPTQAFCARWVSSGAFSDLVRQAGEAVLQETREFQLLDWCAPSEMLRDRRAEQICSDQSTEKMQLICNMRAASGDLLPSMAPRSEAMHRLWKDVPRHRTNGRSA